MDFPCPRCPTVAGRAANLRRHLAGSRAHGGHELAASEITSIIRVLESGATPPARSVVAPAPGVAPMSVPAVALDTDINNVDGDALWQSELRRRQSAWRAAKGYPVGNHGGRPLGSRLRMPEAEKELWNFLTPAIRALARSEYTTNLSRPRCDRGVYGYPRFFADLLSSQPMAFNLFGELALDHDLATVVARRLWPSRVDRVTRLEFEWSPGRWDSRYLDNGTAADVAIFHTLPGDGTGVIFVETKYHENLKGKDYEVKPRYLQVARASGAFREDRVHTLTSGSCQQVWFDHSLALATMQTDRHESALFVVAFPEVNERCRDTVARYVQTLTPAGGATFEARTLEQIVGVMAQEAVTTAREFRERYLTPVALPGAGSTGPRS